MKWLAALLAPALAVAAFAPRRILVATWAPEGGQGRSRLMHGRNDAQDMAEVFYKVGGVTGTDALVRPAADTTQLSKAWSDAAALLDSSNSQGIPAELIMFHTGHADAQGLLLGDQRMPWERVRQFLNSGGNSLRVAFLDACASGNALRTKGGKFHQAVPLATISGHAVLASSLADEISIESDLDGGSLFTRALVSGLRGAADADHDGRVTLSEAFGHAAKETERRSRELGTGTQHPSGSTELQGAVDPVLTDIRNPPAKIRFEPGFPAITIRDSTLRILGTASTGMRDTLTLALSSGLWTLQGDSGRWEMKILLHPGESRVVSPLELIRIPIQHSRTPDMVDTATRWVPINFGILPPVSINGSKPRSVKNAFSLDLILGEAKSVSGFQLSGVMSRTFGNAVGSQMSIAGNTVTGDMAGFQFSNANQIDGNLVGVQLGSYLNVTEGNAKGAQLALLMNVARGRLDGLQLGAADYAGTLRHGAQIALVTVSGHATGLQAGLINVAKELNGLQLGLVNIGSGTGARVGLVNVVPKGRPLSIGAVSVGGDLELHPSVQLSQDLSYRFLLRSRVDWFQSGLILDRPPLPYLHKDPSWSIETSLRAPFVIAPEFGAAWVIRGMGVRPTPDLVAGVSWPLLPHLAPFVQTRWSLEDRGATIWSGVEF